MSFIFVSSPYTHADPAVRHARYLTVARYTARLIAGGDVAYSPIVHSHHLAGFGLPLDHEFWMAQCLPMLRAAGMLHVLRLDGWVESRGVTAEIEEATWLGKPVVYVWPDRETAERQALRFARAANEKYTYAGLRHKKES